MHVYIKKKCYIYNINVHYIKYMHVCVVCSYFLYI